MTYKGVARGKTIELDEVLPFPEGEPVSVSVQPLKSELRPGSAQAIRQAMHEPPHLSEEDVAALERAIEESKLPVNFRGVFDEASEE